jgi:hypothetical protein
MAATSSNTVQLITGLEIRLADVAGIVEWFTKGSANGIHVIVISDTRAPLRRIELFLERHDTRTVLDKLKIHAWESPIVFGVVPEVVITMSAEQRIRLFRGFVLMVVPEDARLGVLSSLSDASQDGDGQICTDLVAANKRARTDNDNPEGAERESLPTLQQLIEERLFTFDGNEQILLARIQDSIAKVMSEKYIRKALASLDDVSRDPGRSVYENIPISSIGLKKPGMKANDIKSALNRFEKAGKFIIPVRFSGNRASLKVMYHPSETSEPDISVTYSFSIL